MKTRYKVDDYVIKNRGDYTFEGIVIAVMQKVDVPTKERRDEIRYAVQNDAGMIHIFNEKQLRRMLNEERQERGFDV